jgi:cytochrome b561
MTVDYNIKEYNSLSKFFHWFIAIMIIMNYVGGLTQKIFNYQFINIHKQLGITILILVILRICWNIISNYPASARELNLFTKIISKFGHLFLYILMILVPFIGIVLVQSKGHDLMIWGIIPIPRLIEIQSYKIRHSIKELHEYCAHTIIILALLHSLFALKHYYVNKDSILQRMLPKNKYL